jgi:4-amino-4-deoxy-L-arabinose transferase-like glycosyltransferase
MAGLVALVSSRSTQAIHFDTAEAFAWGQEFLWGYGKHPPLSGWVAGAWFRVFPAADWAAYALARACVAAALFGVYAVAARSLTRRGALLVVFATAIWAYAHMRGFKYNPDLLLLALVPWLLLAHLRFMERPNVARGLALGVLGAAAMATKYWAALPLLAFVVAVLASPRRFEIALSRGTVSGLAVFALLLAPHAAWLVTHDFAPMTYAAIWRAFTPAEVSRAALHAVGHHLAHVAVPLAVLVVALRGMPKGLRSDDTAPVLVVFAFLVIVPPLAAIATNVLLRSDLGFPFHVLAPLTAALLLRPAAVSRRALGTVAALTGATYVALVVGGAIYGMASQALDPGHPRHRPVGDIARLADEAFKAETGRPVPIVVSSYDIAAWSSFYLPGHPRMLGEADFRMAPWLDRETLAREGFVAICLPGAFGCDPLVFALAPGREVREASVVGRRFGVDGPPVAVRFVVVPPAR